MDPRELVSSLELRPRQARRISIVDDGTTFSLTIRADEYAILLFALFDIVMCIGLTKMLQSLADPPRSLLLPIVVIAAFVLMLPLAHFVVLRETLGRSIRIDRQSSVIVVRKFRRDHVLHTQDVEGVVLSVSPIASDVGPPGLLPLVTLRKHDGSRIVFPLLRSRTNDRAETWLAAKPLFVAIATALGKAPGSP